MADFPYMNNIGTIAKFFDSIQNVVGKPTKVTTLWLESIGFRSSNDRKIVPVIKFIKFIDDVNVPTEKWANYRNKAIAKNILADSIKEGYKLLFETYPDAFNKEDEVLRNFFSTRTIGGPQVLNNIVRTFKSLTALADFTSTFISNENKREPTDNPTTPEKPKLEITDPKKGMIININIQLQLPTTDDTNIYDALFKSLKTHLLS